eukprot:5851110-Prymnesium_polylepis.2
MRPARACAMSSITIYDYRYVRIVTVSRQPCPWPLPMSHVVVDDRRPHDRTGVRTQEASRETQLPDNRLHLQGLAPHACKCSDMTPQPASAYTVSACHTRFTLRPRRCTGGQWGLVVRYTTFMSFVRFAFGTCCYLVPPIQCVPALGKA